AVIERQPARQLPVVLRVPFDVVVAILADGVDRGLRELVVDADRRIGEAEARVQGVRTVVDEIVNAVVVGETALRLEAVLPENADLGVVWPPYLRDAPRKVARRVEVVEGRVV